MAMNILSKTLVLVMTTAIPFMVAFLMVGFIQWQSDISKISEFCRILIVMFGTTGAVTLDIIAINELFMKE